MASMRNFNFFGVQKTSAQIDELSLRTPHPMATAEWPTSCCADASLSHRENHVAVATLSHKKPLLA